MIRSLIGLVMVSLAAACGAAQNPTPDAGQANDGGPVEYKGETTGGPIPDVPREDPAVDADPDAGDFVVDKRCCTLTLSIADADPSDATGRLFGATSVIPPEGLAATRAGGQWTATTCVPLLESTPLYFEILWTEPPPEGAEPGTPGRPMRAVRADATFTTDFDGDGNQVNFYAGSETGCTNVGALP